MGIQNTIQACLPLFATKTVGEIDLEIREELEFHLEMRMRDNLRAGMSADEACRDAQQRFGDFEASRHACRQITLGPKLLLQRIQTVILALLLCAVTYLGARLVELQSANRDQLELLSATIQQLQDLENPDRRAAATIPFVQWKLGSPTAVIPESDDKKMGSSAAWNVADNSTDQHWSDWKSLESEDSNF